MEMGKRIGRLAGVLVLALSSSTAGAFLLELQPAAASHAVGTPFSLSVVLSGLRTDGDFLTAYDLDIGFGSGLTFLGATSTDALGASIFLATPGSGAANIFEASFESDSFFASQPDTLTIANLMFTGNATGLYELVISANAMAGSQVTNPQDPGGPTIARDLLLAFDRGELGASVDIVPGTIPEPATPLLMALAALVGLYLRRPKH
jgi:hypothetical protein